MFPACARVSSRAAVTQSSPEIKIFPSNSGAKRNKFGVKSFRENSARVVFKRGRIATRWKREVIPRTSPSTLLKLRIAEQGDSKLTSQRLFDPCENICSCERGRCFSIRNNLSGARANSVPVVAAHFTCYNAALSCAEKDKDKFASLFPFPCEARPNSNARINTSI